MFTKLFFNYVFYIFFNFLLKFFFFNTLNTYKKIPTTQLNTIRIICIHMIRIVIRNF